MFNLIFARESTLLSNKHGKEQKKIEVELDKEQNEFADNQINCKRVHLLK